MNDGESDSIRALIKILASGGLIGGAAGLAGGVLRSTNPRYNPPTPPAPIVVDMPVPAKGPVSGPIPIPGKTKQLGPQTPPTPAKAAGVTDWIGDQAKSVGNWIYDQAPTFHHPLGPTGAINKEDIPAYMGAAIPVGAAGLGGGYLLGDHVARSVERRRAKAELEEAQREYQLAVTARTSNLYFPKAAGVVDILEDRTPTDPLLARAKVALDAAWAVKQAEGEPDPADVGRGANQATKTILSTMWPGFLNKETAPLQAGVIGALGLTGGVGAYRYFRDQSAADEIRKATEARDRANAARIPAPVIARLVPTEAH